MINRKGIAIPTALILITILFIFLVSMMNFSSQEMVNVKSFYEKKRAEYLAYSGINWAEVKLLSKRWWVSKGFDPASKIARPTGGAVEHEFFGPGNGKCYIIAEEFESANPSLVKGYSKVQRLDHIRVCSIGEYKGHRVLVYGKFIMSPEPFLNSDSTEGADTQAVAITEEGKVLIDIPDPWSQDGPVPNLMIVKDVKVSVGQDVNPNTILATLGAHPDDPVQITMTWDIKAPAFGKLTKINFSPGDQVRARDIFGECTDELMTSTRSNKTLKKMVRITKVIKKDIAELDLRDFEIRRNKLDPFIKKLSDEYVLNYAKNIPFITRLEENFNDPPLGDKISRDEVLRRLADVPPATNLEVQKAGNQFLNEMLEKWVMPGLLASQRKQFPGSSEYHLAIGKSRPRKEIMEVLMHFGRLGEIKTAPQENEELYKIPNTERYKKLMPFDLSGNTDDFIEKATMLANAGKKITITFDKGTPWEDETFQEMVANGEINASDYWYWPSRAGWYTKPDISIEPVSIPYNFVNKSPDKPFIMEMGFVLNYLRKHYDEGMALPPGGPIRLPGDQQDTPQAPGPPDSTGAKYSGFSS